MENRGNRPRRSDRGASVWCGSRPVAGTRSATDRRGNRKAGKNLRHPRRRRAPRLRHRPNALYLELLPAGFCDALGTLGSSDRWLDIGAGTGQAILDYSAPEYGSTPGKICTGADGKVRAVAMSIEDRRTDAWQRQAASLGADRIRYLSGKRLRHYSPEELGKFQIITDVYGGFSYTDDLSGFVERALSLLETGGSFSTRWCKACIWKMAMANPNPGIRPSWSTQPAAT